MKRLPISYLWGLAFILTTSACQPEAVAPAPVLPASVRPHISAFQEAAAARGISVDLSQLQVVLTHTLPQSQAAGLCQHSTEGGAATIYLDTSSVNWKNSYWSREALVFHELAHCFLHRSHREHNLPNGQSASILRSNGDPLYGSLTLYKRPYYLAELFDDTLALPPWALQAGPIPVIPPERKTPILLEDFEDGRIAWPEQTDKAPLSQIREGRYLIESQDTGAFILGKHLPIDPGRDFELSVKMRIQSGTRPALLQWGQAGRKEYYYFGFTQSRYVLAGASDHGTTSGRKVPKINSTGYNTLTLRKSDHVCDLYINGFFFDRLTINTLADHTWGFYIGSNVSVDIDHFYLQYLL